ncbi:hypothetical protein [Biostraticola tofi]
MDSLLLAHLPLPLPSLMRSLYWVHHRQKHLSHALSGFMDYCTHHEMPL